MKISTGPDEIMDKYFVPMPSFDLKTKGLTEDEFEEICEEFQELCDFA